MIERQLTTLTNKPVAVLGAGVTGASVIRYLDRLQFESVWLDTRPTRLSDMADRVQWATQQWPDLDVDVAVVSPGLAMDACLVRGARQAGVQLLSDIDLFFATVTVPVIGITGTNGKSTVTSLVGHLLNAGGISCGVGGNLGDAALDIIDDNHRCYVLELSSFQLERSDEHGFSNATILNVSEDHLDKHVSMQAYTLSKHRVYAQSSRCVYNRDDEITKPQDSSQGISFGLGVPVGNAQWGIAEQAGTRYFCQGKKMICPVEVMPLAGAHNELNTLAAFALVSELLSHEQLAAGLVSFAGLPHRYEKVAEIAGVTYVNDSKATNLGATLAALEGLEESNSVVLIAGGDAKGVDLSPLAALLPGRVSHVIALGKDAPHIMSVSAIAGVTGHEVATLEQAVYLAGELSQAPATVLLSPACASLDMFDSYMHRGDVFVKAVQTLASDEAQL